MSDVKTQRVFVYGTLKRGHRNHDEYLGDDDVAEFMGETTTKEASFLMKEFKSVSSPEKFTPGIFRDGQARIQGELYLVTQAAMDRLDKLEDLGKKYTRSFVTLDNGEQGWMYIELSGNRDPLPSSPHIKTNQNIQEWIL